MAVVVLNRLRFGFILIVVVPPMRLKAFDAFHIQIAASQFFNRFKHFLFSFIHQGNGNAVGAGPAGTSDAVDVVFRLGWQLVVDDERQLSNI